MVTPNRLCDVCERVLHEGGQLTGMVDSDERVQMVTHDGHSKDTNSVQVLSATKDPNHEVIRRRIRAEEISTPDGASCNLNNRACRNEPKRSRHDNKVLGALFEMLRHEIHGTPLTVAPL